MRSQDLDERRWAMEGKINLMPGKAGRQTSTHSDRNLAPHGKFRAGLQALQRGTMIQSSADQPFHPTFHGVSAMRRFVVHPIVSILILSIASLCAAKDAPSTTKPVPRDAGWMKHHERINADVKKSAGT